MHILQHLNHAQSYPLDHTLQQLIQALAELVSKNYDVFRN